MSKYDVFIRPEGESASIDDPTLRQRLFRVGNFVVASGLVATSLVMPHLAHESSEASPSDPAPTEAVTAIAYEHQIDDKAAGPRDEFLRINEARKRAEVVTDSGIKFSFYTPGTSDMEVGVDGEAVNDLTNFVIASLPFFKQDYMPAEDIVRIQETAARGGLGNLEVSVLMCEDDYQQLANPPDLPKSYKTVACPFGVVTDPNQGYRAETRYYPFMTVSFSESHKTIWRQGLMRMFKAIPAAFTPFFHQDGDDARSLSRGQSMTAVFSHELVHILVHPATNIEDHDKEHDAMVTPLGQWVEMLLTDTPDVVNPTPYEVRTAFGIKRSRHLEYT